MLLFRVVSLLSFFFSNGVEVDSLDRLLFLPLDLCEMSRDVWLAAAFDRPDLVIPLGFRLEAPKELFD